MAPRQRLTIEGGAYALDGGSIFLSFLDKDGRRHGLVLVQHRIPMDESDSRIPGRLYLDDEIIKVRSEEEVRLISELKTAVISPVKSERKDQKEEGGAMHVVGEDITDFLDATRSSPEMAIQHLVESLLQFVESEEYVNLANQVENDSST